MLFVSEMTMAESVPSIQNEIINANMTGSVTFDEQYRFNLLPPVLLVHNSPLILLRSLPLIGRNTERILLRIYHNAAQQNLKLIHTTCSSIMSLCLSPLSDLFLGDLVALEGDAVGVEALAAIASFPDSLATSITPKNVGITTSNSMLNAHRLIR